MQTAIRERWAELRALFEAALERPRAQRFEFVSATAPDATLRDAVLALLAREQEPDTLPVTDAEHRAEVAAAAPGIDGALPGYRIQRVLGQGGMGVVYLAQQIAPAREVAIKCISGALDAQALARFEREAAALARLAHPGIAQVYEAGRDATGRPYLVMEYVAGTSLSEFVRTLGRPQRLELLARIADAVAHAHARGVVHRDLKPGNILVTADGHPKVLDFGIASMSGSLDATLTATGAVLGTPAYMSPEQAHGLNPVDARADVYALGAIGYELLADRLPLAVSGLSPLQALRVIGEDTPAPLSRIDRSLRGDLAIVIEKALAKERTLRYASAGAFGDDLRRYLHREPIHARRVGWLRQLGLWSRRNPLAAVLAGLAILGLVGGAALASAFAYAQAKERARAEAALAHSRATLQALNRVFSAGNPAIAGRADVSFKAALASAAEQLPDVPKASRAQVLLEIAQAQSALGDDAAAAENFDQARALAEENGDESLLLHAGLRRAIQLANLDSPQRALAYINVLLARPAIANEPLIAAGLHLQAGLAHLFSGRLRSSWASVQRAHALWPRAERSDDFALRDEIEAELLMRLVALSNRNPETQARRGALQQRVDAGLQRLQARMGPEHPRIVQLRVVAAAMREVHTEGRDWAPALITEIEDRQRTFGKTHPAVRARIEAAAWFPIGDPVTQDRLTEAAARTLQSLPPDSRWRARFTRIYQGQGLRPRIEFFADSEFEAMLAALCGVSQPFDMDCLTLSSSLARRQAFAGRKQAALATLQAAVELIDPQADTAMIATAYENLGRLRKLLFDFEGAAAASERAVAATEIDPELSETERDIELLRIANNFLPAHCPRVLAIMASREARLLASPVPPRDVLARQLSICEVRTGRDPASALARLDRTYAHFRSQGGSPLAFAELTVAYLDIHDFLGNDAEFARWAGELRKLADAGLPLRDTYANARFPGVERALALTEKQD